MHGEEDNVEGAVEEEGLGDEAPVDSPAVHELPAQVECPAHVCACIFLKEWRCKNNLETA